MGVYGMEKIVVFGSTGQVGRALRAAVGDTQAVFLSRNEVNFSDLDAVKRSLDRHQPRVLINAAAYTAVDRAENESSLAHTINGEAPGVIAKWCKERDIPFVHYSTDYVFDGSGDHFWTENDRPSPLNVYGESKLLGERRIQEVGGKYLILRTSWVYCHTGNNFVRTMLKLGQELTSLKVVDDQLGSPTYAPDIARATLVALDLAMRKESFQYGIYHLTGNGVTSWFNFANEIFAVAREQGWQLKVDQIMPIKSVNLPRSAVRPRNSRLDNQKIRTTFGIQLPDWNHSLRDCLMSMKEKL